MTLPFLVVHGAWIWKLVLIALVAGTVSLLAYRRRRAERRAVALELEQLGVGLQGIGVGATRVRGTVTSGGAATDYRRWGKTDESAELVIESDGARLRIESPSYVMQDSHTRRARWFRHTEALTRSIAAGDQVIAVGEVVKASPPDYVMRGARLYATRPDVRLFSQPWRTCGEVAMIGAFWFGALCWIGLNAGKASHTSLVRNGELPAFGRTELAAALPFSRAGALTDLERQVRHDDHITTHRQFELAIQLHHVHGECADELVGFFDPDRAVDETRRCALSQLAEAYVRDGRFAEASDATFDLTSPQFAGEAAIAMGDWNRAAADARRLAGIQDGSERWTCIGNLFDHFAGKTFVHVPTTDGTCTETDAIAGLPVDIEHATWSAKAVLARIAGTPEQRASTTLRSFGLWLAQFDAGEPPSPTHARELARLAMLRGDLERARSIDARGIEAELAIRSGTPIRLDTRDELLRRSLDGDGDALADYLQRGDDVQLEAVMAALPSIRTNREAVLDSVPFTHDTSMVFDIFDRAAFAADARDLARLSGDPVEAARWQAMFERFDRVLADRNQVLAFYLWSHGD